MPALRTRLILGTALLAGLVTAAAGMAGWAVARAALITEFDSSLAVQLNAVASGVESEAHGVSVEWQAVDLPELTRRDHPDLAAVWDVDGTLLVASPAAAGHWRRKPATRAAHPCALPDGATGRRLVRQIVPRGGSQGVTIAVARDASGLEHRLGVLAWVAGMAAVGGALLAAAGMALAVPRLLRPLAQLAGRIEAIDPARPTPLGAAGLVELEPAVRTLDDLVKRLVAVRERERGFVADAAHELRTPLAAVRATLEAATAGGRRDEGGWRAVVATAQSEVIRLQRTVEDLLTLARLEAASTPGTCAPVDFTGVIRQRWDLCATRAVERGLTAEVDLAEAEIVGDEGRLDGIVRNLLENALAHGAPGRLEVILTAISGGWRLCVANPCVGLTVADATRVFERFWRADAARSAGHAGLGLAIARRLAEAVGGSLTVEIADDRFIATLDLLVHRPIMPSCPASENPSTAS